jgi:hypothetical protein
MQLFQSQFMSLSHSTDAQIVGKDGVIGRS